MASHLSYLPRHLSTGTVRDDEDVLLVDSGVSSDTFNALCRARLDVTGVDEAIDWAIGHFRAKGLPFTWWVGPTSQPSDLGERLIVRGLSFGETEMGMVLDLWDPPPDGALPPGLEIRRVHTNEELLEYARVIAANWDPPATGVSEVFRRGTPAVLEWASPARYFLGYLAGEPVATSECFMADGVAGIFNVVTLPTVRRRGIGTACTRSALLEGRACGYSTAVLQASVPSQGIYSRLGFAASSEFREYH